MFLCIRQILRPDEYLPILSSIGERTATVYRILDGTGKISDRSLHQIRIPVSPSKVCVFPSLAVFGSLASEKILPCNYTVLYCK